MRKCPNCEIIMNEVKKINVNIDVCPKCMGIWLDKGELQRIIENEKNLSNVNYHSEGDHEDYRRDDHEGYKNDCMENHENRHYKDKQFDKCSEPYKKRGGFSEILGGIFD